MTQVKSFLPILMAAVFPVSSGLVSAAAISAVANGTGGPPIVMWPEKSVDGDFTYSAFQTAPVVGNGVDDYIKWNLDYTGDPDYPAFSGPLLSARLTLTITPRNQFFTGDIIGITGLTSTLTLMDESLAVNVTSTIELDLLDAFTSTEIMGALASGDAGVLPMYYADDSTLIRAEVELVKIPEPGDFDADGDFDVDDVNLLTDVGNLAAGVAVPPAGAEFDLDGDNLVDTDDLDQWLTDAATSNGFASAYRLGDTDLDRKVDISDFNTLSTHFDPGGIDPEAHLWSRGDFDGDEDVDITDFNNLAGQFTGGATYDSAAATATTDANPGAVDLIVDLATGEVALDGNAAAISGLQVFSAGDSLLTTDFTAEVLQFVISTNTSTYAEGAFVNMAVNDVVALGVLYDVLVNAQDLTFEYTMIGQPTVTGTVIYIPEPASMLLLVIGGLVVGSRRLGMGRSRVSIRSS